MIRIRQGKPLNNREVVQIDLRHAKLKGRPVSGGVGAA
jgi:hypothetical protein